MQSDHSHEWVIAGVRQSWVSLTTQDVLFPDSALAILRTTRWDPHSNRLYEGMSGGLVWDDEFPRDVIGGSLLAFRFVVGYRASLIRDKPRNELRIPWDQLERECPNWPGFRPERRATELRVELEAEEARFLAEFLPLIGNS